MHKTLSEEKNLENMKRCNRFNNCSINICPLDTDVNLRIAFKGEECCPFCLKKKLRIQKGMRTLATGGVLEIVPESNLKMLNRRNQKKWQETKKYGKK